MNAPRSDFPERVVTTPYAYTPNDLCDVLEYIQGNPSKPLWEAIEDATGTNIEGDLPEFISAFQARVEGINPEND